MGKTIEETYKKVDSLEHVLLRPDMYVGSIEASKEKMWVFDAETTQFVQKEIEFIPALYKIYDEILVNAADNKVRDPGQNMIKVDIDTENNKISVLNNGKGIPIEIHKEHGVYVPELIFGHMMTSSNYDEAEKKTTGGRNGYGAKLCNIFSTEFTVETANKSLGKRLTVTWTGNMKTKGKAVIKSYSKDDYTKISFTPDLNRFHMTHLSNDMVSLFRKRAYDIAGTTPGVSVFLDGQRIGFSKKDPFKDYCQMYTKGKILDTGKEVTLIYEKPDNKEAKGRWDVGFAISDNGFQNISFVNSINTSKGGQHVNAIADQLVKKLEEQVNKKNKGGLAVKAHQIKSHCWIFVNSQIENPAFDSQTKETLTLVKSKHGSKPILSDAFIKKVEKSGVVETITNFMKFKENQAKGKIGGKKQKKVVILKLDDAPEAGKTRSKDCTLILTEGDSAKTAALAGVSSMADLKRYYGVFPLRGKLLNAREAGHQQLTKNEEIKNIIQAMGFDFKKKYDNPDDLKSLRYGRLMIMTDQDVDGSHIKGLIINFLHHFWPNMIRGPTVQQFITPIVKIFLKKDENKPNCKKTNFYSLPEFNKWQREVPNLDAYRVEYYKGLGTSGPEEFKEYFQDITRHRIPFRYSGPNCDERIKMAFARDLVDDRKEWLTEYMGEVERRVEAGEDELTLYDREQINYVTYKDFVDKELVIFSHESCLRAIPCSADGLKPGQRKVLWTCFKRKDKSKVKVAQLSGSVSEMSAYHHGEVSLMETIIKLAQNYVGANNVNLLEPFGQFGSRRVGGKDHAAARYIFTKIAPVTRKLYPEADDALFKRNYDDNKMVEPTHYCPIVPMVLVNGSAGIGTGWSTNIPNHNIRDCIKNIRRMNGGKEPEELVPYYEGFRGTIENLGTARAVSFGEIALLESDVVEITELPPQVWTDDFKQKLMKMQGGTDDKGKELPKLIEDFDNNSSHDRVKFIVTLSPTQMREARKQGLHEYFGLVKSMCYTNTMVLFNHAGKLTVYSDTKDIVKDHYALRKHYYVKRHAFLLDKMEARVQFITNRARFILENIEKKITVMNVKRKAIEAKLKERGYASDPVKAWEKKVKKEQNLELSDDEEEDADEEAQVEAKSNYQYLLSMPIYNLTLEKKEALLKEKGQIEHDFDVLKKKTPTDLWEEDLVDLEKTLDKIQDDFKKMEESNAKNSGKSKGKGKKDTSIEPSKLGEYIDPVISEARKKTIMRSGVKSEPKVKKEPKAKAEPKVKAEKVKKETKVKKEADDSLTKKKGKNPWETDSDEDGDDFDFDVDKSSGEEEIITKKVSSSRGKKRALSSDVETKPAAKKQGTIMDAFAKASTKAKKATKVESKSSVESSSQQTTASSNMISSDSEDDFVAAKKKTTAGSKKKTVLESSDDDAEESFNLAARSKPSRARGAKKYNFSSDEDSDLD